LRKRILLILILYMYSKDRKARPFYTFPYPLRPFFGNLPDLKLKGRALNGIRGEAARVCDLSLRLFLILHRNASIRASRHQLHQLYTPATCLQGSAELLPFIQATQAEPSTSDYKVRIAHSQCGPTLLSEASF